MPRTTGSNAPVVGNDASDLKLLVHLLSSPSSPTLSSNKTDSHLLSEPWPQSVFTINGLPSVSVNSEEGNALDAFCDKYRNERKFHQNCKFVEVLTALTEHRICNRLWMEAALPEHCFRLLVCLRILVRDKHMQKKFHELKGITTLAEYFSRATESYLLYDTTSETMVFDVLKEMTNVFHKLSSTSELQDALMEASVHRSLVKLLCANDIFILHCSLYALISLAQTRKISQQISELHCIEVLLRILQEYDAMSKRLSASLLRLLLPYAQTKEDIRVHDGIPVMLSLLHSDNIKLLWHVVWSLVQIAEHPLACDDIRSLGGIPLILSLLHDRKFVSERAAYSGDISQSNPSQYDEGFDADLQGDKSEDHSQHVLSLKSTCCACITELAMNDTNVHQIVANNGIYLLCLLILPQEGPLKKYKDACDTLQRNAFRALRFLFSMERNRRLFKKLFPVSLYEAFIDVGHYVRELTAYREVVDRLNALDSSVVDEIRENVSALNQNREPTAFIRDYAVLEVLGSGAFGTVYKVRRQGAAQSTCYAMKEISTLQSAMGRTAKEKEKSVGELMAELTMAREQLRHPNIVRYFRTFVDNDRLYIVMELIEGASLMEYFTSLREKKDKFSEERIWHIFVQIVLALRYLHKDRGIVHRDLSPNNIMLGENDKVTVTDFGLAKQKRRDKSKMITMVGTLQYSCPEILKSEPYGERADVWAIGCVLHQMATLDPPFNATNLMILTTKIVEGKYKPIDDEDYSHLVSKIVKLCLTVAPEQRPDIVELASYLTDVMLRHLDTVRITQIATEKKLERERRKFQRRTMDVQQTMNAYHQLYRPSSDGYEMLANLGGSGGGASIKDGDEEVAGSSSRPSSGSGAQRRRRVSSGGVPKQDVEEDEVEDVGSGSALPPVPPRRAPTPSGSFSDLQQAAAASPVMRKSQRPISGGGTLTISQRKLREITDPMLPMLGLLHKLVYISQLPPTLSQNPRRRIVDRYKRSLFSAFVSPAEIKEELRKLLSASREIIEFLDAGDAALLARQASLVQMAIAVKAEKIVSDEFDAEAHDAGISYEQMLTMIESLLQESRYYSAENTRRVRSAPTSVGMNCGHTRTPSSGSLAGSGGAAARRLTDLES